MISLAQIGPYRIERLLGAGSFATVWLGHDPSLGARVAIKVLADNWSHDLRVRERFLDEARLLWRLDHERIVRVYSLGELDDGRPYLVMAWADGGSLRDRLAAGPMAVEESMCLLREIVAGVAVLHDNGIVHRDLTPGNVLFRSRSAGSRSGLAAEQVVIADLGLAKALAAASGLTARAGTPGYMAPEQDDPLALVDTRADVYGLGRLGAKLLCTSTAGRSKQVPLREGVPQRIGDVLRTATAHQPEDRYPDATAFGAALDRAAAVTPPRAVARPRSTAGRRRSAVAVGAVLAAALVTAMGSDSVDGGAQCGPGPGTDPSGRITVTLPTAWCVAEGTGWDGQRGPDGELEPALLMSPAPDRWISDPAVPVAFVGLSRSIAARTTPAAFVAEQPHAGCTAAPVRTSRQAGVDWVVAEYTSCRTGKSTIVETAGVGPGDTGLIYVQVAPPAGSASSFVDTVLAGVRVR
jgi:hypothetical protein